MTNLPIASNNSQAAPANATAGTTQKNETPNAQPANPFGAVLARQMQTDEANASAPNMLPAPGIDAKTPADSAIQTDKAELDKALAASGILTDPSSALAAMLQLPQEIKPPAAKDAAVDAVTTAARGITDAVTTARWMTDTMAASRGTADVTMARETNTHKTGLNRPVANTLAIQTRSEIGVATAVPSRGNAAVMVTDSLTVADKLALRNDPVLGIAIPTELPGSLPEAARSAQGVAQSAASVIASGILPNMLTNDKTANSLQTISSPLGGSGWTNEFSQKITWMGTQQNQIAELHLNPPNLGPLDVVLKISDNQATALFTSPHSAVRDAVENALPRLREMLADNGITLGNTMVSDQSPRDRSADGFMNHGFGAAARRETSDETLGATETSTTAQVVPARQHNGMVDTFA